MQPTDFPVRKLPDLASLSTTSSLIGNLKAESPEHWNAFVLAYTPLLRFWIRSEHIPPADEDDVLQETLRSVFSSIGQFHRDPNGGTFRGWLRIIVKRRVADNFRNQPTEGLAPQSVLDAHPVPSPKEDGVVDEEEQALINLKARAMELVRQSTNHNTWEMFWLTVVEGVSPAEVASQFHVSPSAVRMAKARVLNRLRTLLSGG